MQIRPPGYLHAHALDDAAAYLVHTLRACGEQAELASSYGDRSIVVGAHLVADPPADAILFNSEPRAEWTPAYAALLARHEVWDYSPANGHAAVIPFLWCEPMARPIARGDALLFYGSLTPRRVVILDALRAAGVRLDVAFGTYGADRDFRMSRARAVLNLHKTDDDSTFEPIRCFYPLLRGMPVISEETSDPAADDFRASMVFTRDFSVSPIDPAPFRATSAVDRVRAILRNRSARR